MPGDCNLDPPDPAKPIEASNPLVHDCHDPAHDKPESSQTNEPLINRVLDWASSLLPGSDARDQAVRDQALAQEKAQHAAFHQSLKLESDAQAAMYSEFSKHIEASGLFPTEESRTDAYFQLRGNYRLIGSEAPTNVTASNLPRPKSLFSEQQLDYIDKFGWSHSADNPNQWLKDHPGFNLVYTGWHHS